MGHEPAIEHTRLRLFDMQETRILTAAIARIIPADEHGPGAAEVGVPSFIDSQLAGPLRRHLGDYRVGLVELDALAQGRCGTDFVSLTIDQQDELFRAIEAGEGIPDALRKWFGLLLEDTLDGYLSDPVHGGNQNGVGWRVVGYPGPSLVWTEEEQELDTVVPFRGTTALTLLPTGPR